MTPNDLLHKRKKRYVATVLSHFEHHVEPHLPPEAAGAVQDFKGVVRAKINAMAVDGCDLLAQMGAEGYVVNDLALDVRDRLSPAGA